MKKVLFLYYSQTGQTLTALQTFAEGFPPDFTIEYHLMEFEENFPFPWSMTKFFRAFPRCILGKYPKLKEIQKNFADYNLIVLGGPIWFLSPSLPLQSFLASEKAKELKKKPVVVLLTCRNLWYSSVNFIQKAMDQLGADLLGHFILCEKSQLWASFVTTPRWMLTGNKNPFLFFPEAGIQKTDFLVLKEAGTRLGNSLLKPDSSGNGSKPRFQESNLDRLSLRMMNQVGYGFFQVWGKIISQIAPQEGRFQDLLLVLFRVSLVTLILLLLPTTKCLEVFVRQFKTNNP